MTLNPQLDMNKYPFAMKSLFQILIGGRKLPKMNLSDAYIQVELHLNSGKHTTINLIR